MTIETTPAATVLEIQKFGSGSDSDYFAKIAFTDPETGEEITADFKMCHWFKVPPHLGETISEIFAAYEETEEGV